MTKIACPLFTDVLLQYWRDYGFHLYHFKEHFFCAVMRLFIGLDYFLVFECSSEDLHQNTLGSADFHQDLLDTQFFGQFMFLSCSIIGKRFFTNFLGDIGDNPREYPQSPLSTKTFETLNEFLRNLSHQKILQLN